MKSAAEKSRAGATRPRPVESRDAAFFWQGLREKRLLIQRCITCGAIRHPPGPMCPCCRSLEWDTIQSSGKGTLFSFVVHHYPAPAPFEHPNPIGLIQLDEGVRLVGQIVDIPSRDIEIGMAMEAEFREVEPGLVLAVFRPVGVAASLGRTWE